MSKKGAFKLNTDNTHDLNGHQLQITKKVDITFDENSNLIRQSRLLKITDGLLFGVAAVVLPIVNFGLYGTRIRGLRNIFKAKLRNKGIVTIANHCMIMDSPMCAQVMLPRQIYLPTIEDTLKIPKVRVLIKALHAIPIPNNPKGLVHFSRTVESLLYKKKIVHFFPEGSLWPWCKQLRPFKPGAFRYAANTDATLLPIAITFRPRKGLWRLFGKKPLVNITVLPPLTVNKVYRPKRAMLDLCERAFDAMSKLIPPATTTDESSSDSQGL